MSPKGEIVEVALENRDIDDGVTLHWHGYDVPNGEDGVAGVTQDSVMPGDRFTSRFTADQPGTYWYHTHQAASEGVRRGLYGMLVVEPASGVAESLDLALAVHRTGGRGRDRRDRRRRSRSRRPKARPCASGWRTPSSRRSA